MQLQMLICYSSQGVSCLEPHRPPPDRTGSEEAFVLQNGVRKGGKNELMKQPFFEVLRPLPLSRDLNSCGNLDQTFSLIKLINQHSDTSDSQHPKKRRGPVTRLVKFGLCFNPLLNWI